MIAPRHESTYQMADAGEVVACPDPEFRGASAPVGAVQRAVASLEDLGLERIVFLGDNRHRKEDVGGAPSVVGAGDRHQQTQVVVPQKAAA